MHWSRPFCSCDRSFSSRSNGLLGRVEVRGFCQLSRRIVGQLPAIGAPRSGGRQDVECNHKCCACAADADRRAAAARVDVAM